ncbi:ATP-binding protein [Arenicella xantha]|uniref:histidine kinase n=1 Tax=Arenicella xantha TaxID=644221 RepID=A0A395JIM2_9GAMM|nr:ATP-binding protein [Arenicella xantha]RBP48470.1 dedicated sortase system histidine kinase [Arenicella xantha]
MRIRTGFSIRTKLLLVGMLLLLIPWMSYQYVREMKTYLLSGQEQALSLTSRAVATVLHDRPELFSEESQIEPDQSEDNEIYAAPLPNYINLNGDLSDWGEQVKQAELARPVGGDHIIDPNNLIEVRHILGYRGNFIYAMFQVTDDTVLLRPKKFLRVDAADHIRLTLQDPRLPIKRYTLIAGEPGRMSIYLMDEAWQYPITGDPNYDLAAELKLTEQGYNVELRIPRFMLSSDTRISMAVADVDDAETRKLAALIPTTPQSESDELSKLLVESPRITKILKGLDRSETRIWVFNKDKRVRTVVGNLVTQVDDLDLDKPSNETGFDYIWKSIRYYYSSTLQTIFTYIIEQPTRDIGNSGRSIEERNDKIIQDALNGSIASDRRPSLDKQSTILMSAHPIYLGEGILGAVVVEQSTNQMLRQQRETLENVISVTLLVLITVATALLVFASRLTLRIRRLRNATETAIDRDGRIVHQRLNAEAQSGDEIGDLSRSVSNMLGRLSQYTSYLRGLPDTLAHEVSNPLNVVNSSLHNLSEEIPESANSKYMERAKNGLNRIGSILRNLTEAANLEQAMQSETRETVDLVEMIEHYVDGYSFSNPDQPFDVVIHSRPIIVEIAPDYIAQALDKLVDNAIDFAAKGTAIVFKVRRLDNFAQIDIINQGSRLPEGMAERIFEPLVSLGRKDAQKISLGMGLYIVKLIASFHGGDVIARNLLSSDGVIFSLSLPIHDAAGQSY